MTSQQKTKSSVLWAGAVFVLAFLFQLIGMSRQINGYDECIELFGAVRVLHGDVIYRDFWALYGPAQFYVIATLFKLFGISVLVGRLYHVFAGACVIALLFALTARLTSRLTALLAALWAMIWMTGVIDLSYEFPTYPALALILAGIWFLLPLLRNETNQRATVVSGICVGLVTLFRHDFGFYAFVCLILMIAGRGITSHKEGTHFRRIAARNTRESAVFILGLLLILVPSALIIFLHVPFHDVYFALIYVPARIYPKVRSLPFPRPAFLFHSLKMHNWEKVEGAIDYFPGMVCFTSIAYLFASRRTWEEKGDLFGRRLHVLLTLLLVLMTLKGLVRVSPIQLIQAIVLGGAVLAIVLYRMTSRQWYIALLVGCCIVVAALPTRVALKEVLRRAVC
jgi:4-amino-4-deoxy-L-arabinose transferase-like glycosyltransferase